MLLSCFCWDCEVRIILQLDEKKIRKGKPIGLPYIGSKKKISKKIVEIIKQNFGTDRPIYDIFGGGGAITAECLLQGLEVHYNDLDHTITDMFQRILSTDRNYLKTLIVSRDEFLEIREKEVKTVDDELRLLVNSFGNNRKGYLYAKSFADDKYNLAKDIIDNHDVFSGYKQTDTWKNQYRELERLQQLQQLQQLEQLEQLEVTNLDYKAFSDVEGAIFYLDPPYENAAGYVETISRYPNEEEYQRIRNELLKMPAGSELVIDDMVYFLGQHANNKNRMYVRDVKAAFDSQSFYDWAFEMSKKNIVLISSYEISDPRFEVVYEFKTARSTLNHANYGSRYEKLFMAMR